MGLLDLDQNQNVFVEKTIHPQKEEKMSEKKHFTTEQAYEIGNKLSIDWNRFDVEQFRMGLDVELEHGLSDPITDVTGNDPVLTGKIALAHLNEFADYYTRLEKMEREAEEELTRTSISAAATAVGPRTMPARPRSHDICPSHHVVRPDASAQGRHFARTG